MNYAKWWQWFVILLSCLGITNSLAQQGDPSLISSQQIPEVATLLSQYIAHPSISGREHDAGRFFANECQKRGLSVRVLTEDSAQFNFIASLYPLESLKPNIIFLNHIDVVEPGDNNLWTHPPFSGAISDGAVWGRGAIDNKGMGASQLIALAEFQQMACDHDLPFNVSLLAVSGEETGGGNGAAIVANKYLTEINPILVLGEGGTGMSGVFRTNPDKVLYGISINHKRILWLRLRLRLTSAGHGSVPTNNNANVVMVEALNNLAKRKNNLYLSSAARIMFAEIGQHETGMTGIALRNLGIFKSITGSALRREPIIHALVTNTVTLTNISNPAVSKNQVPQEVEAILDCRLLPETETDDFIRELRHALNQELIEIDILKETVRADDSRPEAFYAMLESAVRQNHRGAEVTPILFPATNDNNYFRSKGILAYGILPMHLSSEQLSSIHNFNEHVSISELERSVAIYRDFLQKVFEPTLSPGAITQTVRGKVLDKYLNLPLSNCVVVLSNDTSVVSAAQTTPFGDFRMDNVPIGRYTLKVFSDGYKDITLPNVMVHSAREVLLTISLEEAPGLGTTRPLVRHMGAQNEMATVSSRTFNVEETSRYPGNRDDPARMVANFAGVRGVDDSRNDIIIRGNSPNSLGWRLEDIDIPNPNHFAIFGTSGGGVNLINSKVLDRSDFYTGAFPAEFGNALSGVFDLQLRAGNNEHHEFTVETGTINSEISVEGPLSRSQGSSYLASYRQSTFGLMERLIKIQTLEYARRFGIDGIPDFQDFAFKLNFPKVNNHSISIFGTGGTSEIALLEANRHPCSFSYLDHGQDVHFGSKMAVAGMHYLWNLTPSSFLKATAYTSYQGMSSNRVRVFRDSISDNITGYRQEYWNQSSIQTAGLALRGVKKISARNTLKSGFNVDHIRIHMRDTLSQMMVSNSKEFVGIIRSFAQWKHTFSNAISIVAGANGMLFTLNNSWSVDPRIGLTWQLTPRRSLSVGAGIHSQLQPLYFYFQEMDDGTGNRSKANQNLGLTRSQYYMLSYQNNITERLQFRTEVYFQNLFQVPVERQSSSWSMVNQGLDFKLSFPGPLMNAGTGQNYGAEFTLERAFNKGYYFLINFSLYDSKYTGSDQVRRNTDYNGSYTFNVLLGREFSLGPRQTLALSLRNTAAGGRRHMPIDLEASRVAENTVYIDSLAYSLQYPLYYRADLKMEYRLNTPKIAHEFSLDLINIIPFRFKETDETFIDGCYHFPLSTRNILTSTYDAVSGQVREEYQLEFLPILYYRIHF